MNDRDRQTDVCYAACGVLMIQTKDGGELEAAAASSVDNLRYELEAQNAVGDDLFSRPLLSSPERGGRKRVCLHVRERKRANECK